MKIKSVVKLAILDTDELLNSSAVVHELQYVWSLFRCLEKEFRHGKGSEYVEVN